MPESALSPQPPNPLEPLAARHSQFFKRVKPASLGGTNGCTQSGPPMLTIQVKPTYITYSCSQPEKQASKLLATRSARLCKALMPHLPCLKRVFTRFSVPGRK